MAEIIRNYFTPRWRTDRLDCVCGWEGASADMQMELHEDVTDYACPACENTLLIVSHPDMDQVLSLIHILSVTTSNEVDDRNPVNRCV